MPVPCSLILLNVKILLNDAGLIHWSPLRNTKFY